MKIVFINEKFRRVAKFVKEDPQKHFLFACIQKSQEPSLLNGEPIIGSICKLLDLEELDKKNIGFALGICPAEVVYDHTENLIDFSQVKVIHEENDLSKEEYNALQSKMIELLEKYKHEMNFQQCSNLSLKDMKLEDIIGQFGSYGPLSLQKKLTILETPSLKQRTQILIDFLSDLKHQKVTVPFANHIRQN